MFHSLDSLDVAIWPFPNGQFPFAASLFREYQNIIRACVVGRENLGEVLAVTEADGGNNQVGLEADAQFRAVNFQLFTDPDYVISLTKI
jgi:hypothetical protein